MYEPYSYVKGTVGVTKLNQLRKTMQERGIDCETVTVPGETNFDKSETFLFVEARDRVKATMVADPIHVPKDVKIPSIPPDPENLLGNHSYNWRP